MRLLIVDDDPLVCQSLRHLLGKEEDLEIIGTAGNGKEALRLCSLEPDLVLMDIRMPVMDGIACAEAMKRRFPSIRIVMLTTFEDKRSIRLALQAGAEGYLLKSAAGNMPDQIRAIASGTAVLSSGVLRTIMGPDTELLKRLTERETEIVELVAQGLSNKEISERLYLGTGTVRNMLTIILDKLELRDRTQLAIYYWQGKRQ